MSDPAAVYTERLSLRTREIHDLELAHRRLGNLRLLTFAAGVAIVWLALFPRSLSIAWLGIPILAFSAQIVVHERLLARLGERRRAAAFYEKGLARLDGRWTGTGDGGVRHLDPRHLYAQDLDIFGSGSLFQLLSTARTHIGEDTLARWLLQPAPPDVVVAR